MLGRLGELRTRLTLWYTTLLAGLLLVLGVAAFTLLYAYLVAKRARLLRAERGALA